MEGYKIPLFKQGNLLTRQMLESIEDYEISFSRTIYSGYSNGILRGCNIRGEQGVIYVDEGIIIFDEQILFVPNTVVAVSQSNNWQALKIYVQEINNDANFCTRNLYLAFSDKLDDESNAIELCRVRLQQGAIIRCEYRNFEDLNTEFDTINVVNSQWSSFEEKSISPLLLKAFANEAIKSSLSNPADIAFIQSIMSMKGETLTRGQIQFYISSRLGMAYTTMSNIDIFNHFSSILRQIKTGRTMENNVRRERKIFVD